MNKQALIAIWKSSEGIQEQYSLDEWIESQSKVLKKFKSQEKESGDIKKLRRFGEPLEHLTGEPDGVYGLVDGNLRRLPTEEVWDESDGMLATFCILIQHHVYVDGVEVGKTAFKGALKSDAIKQDPEAPKGYFLTEPGFEVREHRNSYKIYPVDGDVALGFKKK
jgi:hypothetical protein